MQKSKNKIQMSWFCIFLVFACVCVCCDHLVELVIFVLHSFFGKASFLWIQTSDFYEYKRLILCPSVSHSLFCRSSVSVPGRWKFVVFCAMFVSVSLHLLYEYFFYSFGLFKLQFFLVCFSLFLQSLPPFFVSLFTSV